jgi:hypothetical protein
VPSGENTIGEWGICLILKILEKLVLAKTQERVLVRCREKINYGSRVRGEFTFKFS